MRRFRYSIALALCLALATPLPAQMFPPATAPSQPAAGGAPVAAARSFQQEELDQLLAPIALHPDALLAQVLMAATYPIEVVQAERWVKANPGLKDKALQDALQQQPWDASVKSLAAVPQALAMMSERLEWTQKLGDAFLAQPDDVMATVQALRAKAVASGSLKDTKEQKVTTGSSGGTTYIVIEPADPEVVYVPAYDPTMVYGPWWYPSYPPYYWYPPGYAYAPGLWFAAGIIVGGALWGNVVWPRGDVNVNVNRYNNFNRTNISDGTWRHSVEHRGAVPYRDQRVAQQYGRGQSADAASRDAFRGRAEGGRDSISRGEASSRDAGGRDAGAARGASAFDTRSSAQTRDFSSRGSASMNSARSSGNMGGGARAGGGGGARGGGGGGRGGGGRR